MSSRDIETINIAIRKDSKFLSLLGIMDYSILLGIESKLQINTEEQEHTVINAGARTSVRTPNDLLRFKRHRFTSPDGMQTYHVSIIDFLQKWNHGKRCEKFMKINFLRANKK